MKQKLTTFWSFLMPMIVIIFFSQMTRTVYSLFEASLLNQNNELIQMRIFAIPLTALFLLALLIFATRRYSFNAIFKTSIIGFASINLIIFCLYPMLEAKLAVTRNLLYLISILWSATIPLLIWGYANNTCSFKKAARVYPLLIIIFAISDHLFTGAIVPYFTYLTDWGSIIRVGSALSLFAGIVIYTTFNWMAELNSDSDSGEGRTYLFRWDYVLALGLFLLLFHYNESGMTLFWNNTLKNFEDPNLYRSLKAIALFGSIISLFIMITLSFTMPKHPKRTWVAMALALPISVLGLGGLFFISHLNKSYLLPQPVYTGGLYHIYGVSILPPLILLIKEMAFIPIKIRNRFASKLIVDVIFGTGAIITAPILIPKLGGMGFSLTPTFFLIGFMITIVFWYMAARYLGNRVAEIPRA